ncbi:MAG: hypothetical protein RR090_02430 [Niameybacter sp.]
MLDIQMKQLTGIDVAKILRQTNQTTIIIFITAEDWFSVMIIIKL